MDLLSQVHLLFDKHLFCRVAKFQLSFQMSLHQRYLHYPLLNKYDHSEKHSQEPLLSAENFLIQRFVDKFHYRADK